MKKRWTGKCAIMGRLKDFLCDENIDEIEETVSDKIEESAYPKRLRVDGYDVYHYHDGEIPVYKIYGSDGKMLGMAHSTNEMHEITGSKE